MFIYCVVDRYMYRYLNIFADGDWKRFGEDGIAEGSRSEMVNGEMYTGDAFIIRGDSGADTGESLGDQSGYAAVQDLERLAAFGSYGEAAGDSGGGELFEHKSEAVKRLIHDIFRRFWIHS